MKLANVLNLVTSSGVSRHDQVGMHQGENFAKYWTNMFRRLKLYFWISGSSEKENKSKPKNSAGEFTGSEEIFYEGKGPAGIESKGKTATARVI